MKPLILITNDDGIFSPGLQAAAEAVADLGDLLIVAPRHQQTSMSRALPSGASIGIIEEVTLEISDRSHIAYALSGSPALAVINAVFELAPTKPALCISGINYGENVGLTTGISGTIGAALEASVCGIPAIAISREADLHLHRASDYATLDWRTAKHFTRHFAEKVLEHGLPLEISVLNINIPANAAPSSEVRATIQSQQAHYYFVHFPERDRTKPFRPNIELILDRERLEPDSDIQGFLFDHVVTVTPLTNDLTANVDRKQWFSAFNT
jgi:5'-nucleotidase